MRSPCTAKSESGRRSRNPPPGTATMTNCPGAARRATRGAMSSTAANAPKWRTPATRQWDGLRPLGVVVVRLCWCAVHRQSVAACRSCRQCTCTRGRWSASIADTAAEAPARVVMEAMPLRRAVVRIS